MYYYSNILIRYINYVIFFFFFIEDFTQINGITKPCKFRVFILWIETELMFAFNGSIAEMVKSSH